MTGAYRLVRLLLLLYPRRLQQLAQHGPSRAFIAYTWAPRSGHLLPGIVHTAEEYPITGRLRLSAT